MKIIAQVLSLTSVTVVFGLEDFEIKLYGSDTCFSIWDGRISPCGDTDTIFQGDFNAASIICGKEDTEQCITAKGDLDPVADHPKFELVDGVLKADGFCIASDGNRLVKMRKGNCDVKKMPTELDIDGYLKFGDECLNPGKVNRKAKIGPCDDNSSWWMDGDKIRNNISDNCLTTKGKKGRLATVDCSIAESFTLGEFFKQGGHFLARKGKVIKISNRDNYAWLEFNKK